MSNQQLSKRGAPEKPPEQRKSFLLGVRMTEAEREEIPAADGKTSTWAREAPLRAARSRNR